MMPRQSMLARARWGRSTAAALAAAVALGLGGCRSDNVAARTRPWRVAVLQLDDGADRVATVDAIGEGLRQSGMQPDSDYVLTVHSAHGDRAALPDLLTVAERAGANTVATVGTAALRAALAAGGSTPVVFTAVADPWAAGVRRSSWWRRWLPFLFADPGPPVTGAYAATEFGELLETSGDIVRNRHYGAVVPVADGEAPAFEDALRTVANWQSRQVDFEPASDAADIGPAAARLCGQGVMGLVALGDSTSTAAFDDLAKAARQCQIPILGTLQVHAAGGAILTLARQPGEAAREAGRLIARLASGTAPADLPVVEIAQAPLIINAETAEKLDIGIPLSVLERADEVLDR